MNTSPFVVEISDQQNQSVNEAQIILAIKNVLGDHDVDAAEISVAIVDDPTMRRLNKQYLNHDYETDVLSFVLDEDLETNHLTGQLIVSTDTAATLAAEVGVTMQEELLLYVIHGTLHLVGYDDKDPAAAVEMRSAERQYLKGFGIEHRGFCDVANKAESS